MSVLISFISWSLVSAGLLKVAYHRDFHKSLHELFPTAKEGAVRSTGVLLPVAEIGVGGGLVLSTGPIQTISGFGAVGLGVGFLATLFRARSKGQGCGCYGPLSSSKVGTPEILRAAGLLASAVLVSIGALSGTEMAVTASTFVTGTVLWAISVILPTVPRGGAASDAQLESVAEPAPALATAGGGTSRRSFIGLAAVLAASGSTILRMAAHPTLVAAEELACQPCDTGGGQFCNPQTNQPCSGYTCSVEPNSQCGCFICPGEALQRCWCHTTP